MDVKKALEEMEVVSDVVEEKAGEILRLMQLKIPPPGLHAGEIARPAIAAEIACRLCGHMRYNKEGLIRASHVKANALKKATSLVEAKLDLRHNFLTFQQLSIKFGGAWFVKTIEEIYQRYQELVKEKVHESGRDKLDFKKPEYIAALFYLVATKKFKHKVEKRKLLEDTRVPSSLFKKTCDSVEEVCSSYLHPLNGKRARGGNGKEKENTTGDDGGEDSQPNSESTWMPSKRIRNMMQGGSSSGKAPSSKQRPPSSSDSLPLAKDSSWNGRVKAEELAKPPALTGEDLEFFKTWKTKALTYTKKQTRTTTTTTTSTSTPSVAGQAISGAP